MAESRFKDVDEYIGKADSIAQPHLLALRALVRKEMPEAKEIIYYNVPYYKYEGNFGGFAVYKKHVSIGFGPESITDNLRSDLLAKGYRVGKGTLSIPFDQKIPEEEIKKMIKNKKNESEHK